MNLRKLRWMELLKDSNVTIWERIILWLDTLTIKVKYD